MCTHVKEKLYFQKKIVELFSDVRTQSAEELQSRAVIDCELLIKMEYDKFPYYKITNWKKWGILVVRFQTENSDLLQATAMELSEGMNFK